MKLLRRLAERPKWLAIAIGADVLLCGLVYALLEDKGPIQGIWWAIVTGSTVGYGDFYPATTAGRGVGAFLIITMWWLTILAGAQVTARLISDPDCFTDAEQRRLQWEQRRQSAMLTVLVEKYASVEEVDKIERRFSWETFQAMERAREMRKD